MLQLSTEKNKKIEKEIKQKETEKKKSKSIMKKN